MAMAIQKKYLLLAAVLASLEPGCVAQTSCPADYNIQNTVAVQGMQQTFTNLLTGQSVQWQIIPTSSVFSDEYAITNYDNNVASTFMGIYAVTTSQLTILNPTAAPQGQNPYSTSGTYILNYQNPNCTTAAALIVITNGPLCSCNASDPNNVQLYCNVVFGGFQNQYITPVYTWINSIGVPLGSFKPPTAPLDPNNPGLQGSASQYSISSTDGSTYQCELTFDTLISSNEPSYYAANDPSFTASCYTSCPQPTTTPGPVNTATMPCTGPNLINTVVPEGTQVTFPCQNTGQLVQWQIAPSSVVYNKLQNITNYNNFVAAPFTMTNSLSPTSLTVMAYGYGTSVSPYSESGLYTLNYQNPKCTTAANLILINTPLACACINFQLTCTVVYAQAVTQPCNPIFTWTNSAGTQVMQQEVQSHQINANYRQAQSQLSIFDTDFTIHQCQLTFSSPGPYPYSYVTQQPPTYNATCSATCN